MLLVILLVPRPRRDRSLPPESRRAETAYVIMHVKFQKFWFKLCTRIRKFVGFNEIFGGIILD